jgi:hypothetical protein
MRSLWHWLGTVLLVVAGCRTTPPELKPPQQPDDYSLPAEDDPRYNQPYKYTQDPNDPSLGPSHKSSGSGNAPGMGPRGGRGPMGPGGPTSPVY